jgi:hypothetical protein
MSWSGDSAAAQGEVSPQQHSEKFGFALADLWIAHVANRPDANQAEMDHLNMDN